MARYGTIFAGPVEKTMPYSRNTDVDVDLAPGTIVTLNGDQEFVAHATQGVRGAFYILAENYLTQDDTDTDIPANQTGIGYLPDESCFFHVLVETGTSVVRGVTQLTSNGSGALEIAASGDDVMFIADETYNNTTGSNQLVLVRPYKGSVA